MAKSNQQHAQRGSRRFQPNTEPVRQVAARWSNLFTSGDFAHLDEMTRLAPGSGSIGGGNSIVQDLSKGGSLTRDIYPKADGSAMVLFKSGGKPVGCAYLQISGQYVTEAKIGKF